VIGRPSRAPRSPKQRSQASEERQAARILSYVWYCKKKIMPMEDRRILDDGRRAAAVRSLLF
jgi:hypothetical protein